MKNNAMFPNMSICIFTQQNFKYLPQKMLRNCYVAMQLVWNNVEKYFNSEPRNKIWLSSSLNIYCTFHESTKQYLFSPFCACFSDLHLKND